MAVSYVFADVNTQVVVGSTTEDSVTIQTDVLNLSRLATTNGNLSWRQADGSAVLVTAEIDFVTVVNDSTVEHYYMNLNTKKTASVGFLMDEKARAIVSTEWLAGYFAGDFSITYENRVGGDATDTIISGGGGETTLVDYNLGENAANLTTIGTVNGASIIDFNIVSLTI